MSAILIKFKCEAPVGRVDASKAQLWLGSNEIKRCPSPTASNFSIITDQLSAVGVYGRCYAALLIILSRGSRFIVQIWRLPGEKSIVLTISKPCLW
jgi:hypothetical protein